jgi:hypothetical protein
MTAHRVIETGSSVFADIAAVIGNVAARQLCETLGGTRVYVPRQVPRNHGLVVAIGADAAAKLADHYHGTVLPLPKMHLRREMALRLVREGKMKISEIARVTDYTESHIYYLIDQEKADQPQFQLPGILD